MSSLHSSSERRLQQALVQLEEQSRQITDLQHQLILSEKLASLGTLVVGVAHELNNPAHFSHNGALNLHEYLQELLHLLHELAEDNEDAKCLFDNKFTPIFRNLSAIVDGTERIQTIVTDLRTFSRMDDMEPKQVSVLDGLRLTLALVQANYKDDVDFATELSPVPALWCWPAQLNQVYMNLLVNACQAIIARKQEQPDHQGRMVLQTLENGAWAVIRFIDNGIGMEQEVLDHIFDPFFSTRKGTGGTGLGLSISHDIIEKHKGELRVESTPGQGTIFEIRLPLPLLSSQQTSSEELTCSS